MRKPWGTKTCFANARHWASHWFWTNVCPAWKHAKWNTSKNPFNETTQRIAIRLGKVVRGW